MRGEMPRMPFIADRLRVVDHPAVADRLTRIRDRTTPTPIFRRLIEDVGLFLAYEATRDLALAQTAIETPVAATSGPRIDARVVVAPILRAGLGLLPGFLHVVDGAVVAHLGFFRNPQTLEAVPYYANLPDDLRDAHVFALDPMLATGHSGAAAIGVLKERGARNVALCCVIAAPAGIDHLVGLYPDVTIYTCAVDHELNEHGYIVPGLGDAGDRMFGSASSVPASFSSR
jgi:uracil phosphoribosyltransferase